MERRQSAYTLGQINPEKGNSLDLHLYKEGEGWKHINKKASDLASFKQLHTAMKDLAKQSKKAGWKYRINLWHEGTLKTATICKEWSF